MVCLTDSPEILETISTWSMFIFTLEKIEKWKIQMKDEKRKKEEKYKKRLEQRLASGDFRIWTTRRRKFIIVECN